MSDRPTISMTEATARVGRAWFGGEWIGWLTEREHWLLRRYVDDEVRPTRPRTYRIRTDGITYYDAGTGRPILAPSLQAEVDRAQDRREQMNDQHARVRALLKRRGFDADSAQLDLAQFGRCFAEAERARALLKSRGAEPTEAAAPAGAEPPGPKGGEPSVDRLAWEIAEAILKSADPPRGHGRLTALARLVNVELAGRGHKRQDDSIRKAIGKSFRGWEASHPEKSSNPEK